MQKKPTTQLGRSCIQPVDRHMHMNTLRRRKQHRTKNSLRDVILGGQDGLVNMLGIALGVVAAGGSNHVLVVTGIAAAITESISMGAVAYTSFGSDRDFYLAERETEQNEISSQPEEEREEIREIYAAKGFSGQLLDEVVSTITSNRETWINTMMNEELHIQHAAEQSLLRSAAIVTVTTLIGHLNRRIICLRKDARKKVAGSMGLIPNGALKQAESYPVAEFTSFVKSASRY